MLSTKTKALRLTLALALCLTTPVVDAQILVCGPNGCARVSAPIQRVASVAVRPIRMVRSRGLFGRRYSMEQTTTSSGSTGGYSYGSTGGTATYETVETPSYGSTGGSGSYSAPQAPAATVPLSSAKGPRCQCGAACECVDCDCQTALCRIPKDLPHTATCRVPRLVTTATCRVPVSGPSVEAVAAL